jgi:phage terminase large subunit-like protein
MTRDEQVELLALLEERDRRAKRRKIWSYFPDAGPLRRELYQKHLEFFAAGLLKRIRLALCANRIGKTESMGGYEVACHLTGEYPAWWNGRRFAKPVKAWAAGDTAKTTRDAIQEKMLGGWNEKGTGLILGDAIVGVSPKQGIPEAAEIVTVRHKTGGLSQLMFKSFDQGRRSFQGTAQDIIWLDEECPIEIYQESLLRTMTTEGIIILTFTPLMGLTELVLQFLEDGAIDQPLNSDTKQVITATWDDVPHLTAAMKQAMLENIDPARRDARSKGVPQLGAGAIYPVSEDDYVVDDFPIPPHWPRWFGLDVGWNRTAAVHMAWDRETDTIYEYYCHYRGEAEPSVHVVGIQAPGKWIPGVIDPAARGRSQIDGRKLIQMYRDLGLELNEARNSVEAGIYEVWQRLASGKLKTFRSCRDILAERRMYRRDEKGQVVKSKDHAMDAERYGVVSGREIGRVKPVEQEKDWASNMGGGGQGGWLA